LARKRPLTVVFSEKAREDVLDIWSWNARQYDADHADRHAAFLLHRIEALAARPAAGTVVPEVQGMWRETLRRRQRGHGHIVFYVVEADVMQIVRILHTARDWPKLIDGENGPS
jgi:plasmid stabilization system protein ParE